MELQAGTRELILDAEDLVKERVDCPEWGCFVYIRTMSIKQRTQWEQSLIAQQAKADNNKMSRDAAMENAVADLIARCACNEDGSPLFRLEDAVRMGEKSSGAMQRCYDVAARLNYLTNAHVQELVKN